jgi:hypothetical protein
MKTEIDIESIKLLSGGHSGPESGFCVMEMAAYMAGEPWSDHPACVSAVLGAFLRSWNDALDDDTRQKLKPYVKRVIGTAGDGKDDQRAWMCVDWIARTQLPAWLDLAGLTEHAAAVRGMIAISDTESAALRLPTLAAALAAARDAAWDAAHHAAAGAAARAAAGAAAGAAARAAAAGAAGAAARAAALAAAGAAAEQKLAPTVTALQASAFELLDRMITA